MNKYQPICCIDCYKQLGWTHGYHYLPCFYCDECMAIELTLDEHETEKET